METKLQRHYKSLIRVISHLYIRHQNKMSEAGTHIGMCQAGWYRHQHCKVCCWRYTR